MEINVTLATLGISISFFSRALASTSLRLLSTKASIWFWASMSSSMALALTATRVKVPMISRQATVMPMAAKDIKPWLNILYAPSLAK